jgi:hypothetical protein
MNQQQRDVIEYVRIRQTPVAKGFGLQTSAENAQFRFRRFLSNNGRLALISEARPKAIFAPGTILTSPLGRLLEGSELSLAC